ncbi:MAG: hypothetical protein HW412_1760 [Bacteroidetes bacterium]|nr:hypothetical protein [Bacteroidota bacterium]
MVQDEVDLSSETILNWSSIHILQSHSMSLTYRSTVLRLMVGALLSLLTFSCKDYEYTSPLPGVLEVRLKVVNNQQQYLPFGNTNFFVLILKELNATLPGNVKQPILSDVYAIRRNPDGDLFNTLDTLARDSSFVLGQAYSPPVAYSGLDLTANFPLPSRILIYRNRLIVNTRGDTVLVLGQDTILVLPPPPPAPPVETFFQIPASANTPIQINEGRLTVVTIVFDLDYVLRRRQFDFEFHPSFYISSVKNY